MVNKTKKRPLDSRDREILRLMIGANRPITANQISKKLKLSAPAVKPRLINLKTQGIIKPVKIGEDRIFNRQFKKNKKIVTKRIISPSKILWDLDLKLKKMKKMR